MECGCPQGSKEKREGRELAASSFVTAAATFFRRVSTLREFTIWAQPSRLLLFTFEKVTYISKPYLKYTNKNNLGLVIQVCKN